MFLFCLKLDKAIKFFTSKLVTYYSMWKEQKSLLIKMYAAHTSSYVIFPVPGINLGLNITTLYKWDMKIFEKKKLINFIVSIHNHCEIYSIKSRAYLLNHHPLSLIIYLIPFVSLCINYGLKIPICPYTN